MWGFGHVDDFTLSDLRQENEMLRLELSELYEVVSQNESNQSHLQYSTNSTQTESELASTIPDVAEKIKGLTCEVSYQRSLNAEQANKAKEMERRIRECESKLLDANKELLLAIPLRAKVEELEMTNNQMQVKISGATQEYLNLTVELNFRKTTIDNLSQELSSKVSELNVVRKTIEEEQEKLKSMFYEGLNFISVIR